MPSYWPSSGGVPSQIASLRKACMWIFSFRPRESTVGDVQEDGLWVRWRGGWDEFFMFAYVIHIKKKDLELAWHTTWNLIGTIGFSIFAHLLFRCVLRASRYLVQCKARHDPPVCMISSRKEQLPHNFESDFEPNLWVALMDRVSCRDHNYLINSRIHSTILARLSPLSRKQMNPIRRRTWTSTGVFIDRTWRVLSSTLSAVYTLTLRWVFYWKKYNHTTGWYSWRAVYKRVWKLCNGCWSFFAGRVDSFGIHPRSFFRGFHRKIGNWFSVLPSTTPPVPEQSGNYEKDYNP